MVEELQIKNRLDPVSLKKIGKGALISATGAAGLYLLSVLGTLELQNPILVGIIVWFIPFATNTLREWMKGVVVDEA